MAVSAEPFRLLGSTARGTGRVLKRLVEATGPEHATGKRVEDFSLAWCKLAVMVFNMAPRTLE